MIAFVDLNEKKDRIKVTFPYEPSAVHAIKSVQGARFKDKGGPHWLLPLDISSARELRAAFTRAGHELKLSPAAKKWGHAAVRKEENLTQLGAADDAELEFLPKLCPKLAKWLRPYQRADVAFLARADAINANHPGLGKTAEAIGAVFEAQLHNAPKLVVAPKSSLETVWLEELKRWQKQRVLVTSGDDTPKQRQAIIEAAWEAVDDDEPFWLVINHHMLRYQRDRTANKVMEHGREEYPLIPVFGELYNIPWSYVIVDEYHKMGLANNKSLMARSLRDVPREKLLLMSGTPMGGKPIKLWSALHHIEPAKFTSKWRWAGMWLEITDHEAAGQVHKTIEGIRPEREEAFYKEHAPHLLRRTKAEVLPQLPAKQYTIVTCKMTKKQRKQYDSVSADAEVKIADEHLSIVGVLAEYTRLKQFSNSHHIIKHMAKGELKLLPTGEGGKFPQLLRILEENGITGEQENAEGDEKVVVFSQFSSIVDCICDVLEREGIEVSKITGSVNRKGERTRIQREFQGEDGPRVICMTTGAGGVSVTLDRASTVVFFDETWDPDDQEQGEDRVHRASRMHQVMVYYLRSEDSIEERIAEVTGGKKLTNKQILDAIRLTLKIKKAEKEHQQALEEAV